MQIDWAYYFPRAYTFYTNDTVRLGNEYTVRVLHIYGTCKCVASLVYSMTVNGTLTEVNERTGGARRGS